MRIKEVSVKNLFGTFDHRIPFNLGDHITIIHGPNGFGKTVMLRMVDGFIRGDYSTFRDIPFSTFELISDDGTIVHIFKSAQTPLTKALTIGRRKVSQSAPLECAITRPNGKIEKLILGQRTIADDDLSPDLLTAIDRILPGNLRLVGKLWQDMNTGESLTFQEILEEYGERHIRPAFPDMWKFSEPQLRSIREALHVRFIRTQRLDISSPRTSPARSSYHIYSEPDVDETVLSVQQYSGDLSRRMQAVIGSYAARSAELDRTFPERLLKQEHERTLSTDELRDRLHAIEDKRKQLISLGFIDEHGFSVVSEQLLTSKPDVMSIYVNDIEKKLGVFDAIVARIGLFVRIVNDRFKYKRLTVHRDIGFVLTAKLGPLSPVDLSSGEQHELVLLYDLIFNVDRTWLVLIDEPEISLHTSWQSTFLTDLKQIVQLSNVDVVLATHSPVLIGDNWDLTVALKGPSEA